MSALGPEAGNTNNNRLFVFGTKVFQCSDVNVKTASLNALGF